MTNKIPLEQRWTCTKCEWEGHVDDIRKEVVFHATREEPDEWEWYCPICQHTEYLIECMEHYNWCRVCEDEVVKEDGGICAECYTCERERLCDEARGH